MEMFSEDQTEHDVKRITFEGAERALRPNVNEYNENVENNKIFVMMTWLKN